VAVYLVRNEVALTRPLCEGRNFEGSVGVRSKELGKSIGKDLIMARKI
jgi:hypothetical protein